MKLRLLALTGWLLAGSALAEVPEAEAVTNLWQFHIPGNFDSEASPALAPDGTVYLGTFQGWLFAFAPEGKL